MTAPTGWQEQLGGCQAGWTGDHDHESWWARVLVGQLARTPKIVLAGRESGGDRSASWNESDKLFKDNQTLFVGHHRAGTLHSLALPAGFRHLSYRTVEISWESKGLARKPRLTKVTTEDFVTETVVKITSRVQIFKNIMECQGIKPRKEGDLRSHSLHLLSHYLCI